MRGQWEMPAPAQPVCTTCTSPRLTSTGETVCSSDNPWSLQCLDTRGQLLVLLTPTVYVLTIYGMSTQEIPMIWDGKQKSEKCDNMRIVTLLIVFSGLIKSHPRRKDNETRELRAIVPQLLPNYTTSTLPPAHQVRWMTTSDTINQPFSKGWMQLCLALLQIQRWVWVSSPALHDSLWHPGVRWLES